ncbi:MAG: hypothetical protein KBF99_07915 [Leptospiraceae bacterium]|nr:hypothetical protein [Leptospiraceae bacterium]MBP9163093.1 hypothetical protein [Leptospiraceae bacterium]
MKYLIIYFLSISFFLNCYSDSTPSRSNPLDAKGGVGLFVNLFLYNLRYPAPKANTATTSTGTPPSGLSYYELSYKFFLLQPASAGLVNVSGSVTSCTASPALPAGLTLNPSTCEIGGSPTVLQAATLHLITASNSHGGTTTDIRVTVAYPVVPYVLAGSGSPGSTDGSRTAASFYYPSGIAIGSEGNSYVADENNEKIRRVTSSGDVTTFAGSGSYAYTEGLAASAAFRSPLGVAIDTSGNLYIADSNNHRIRKISSGTVSTLAGSGSSGSTDANGTSASFNTPSGIAIDTSGNLYVADTINNKIRKVTSGGIVSSIGGAVFSNPLGVAVDSLGNIYIADTNNNKIKMMTQAGVVTTIGGTGDSGFLDGPALSALFDRPSGVAVDSNGNVYIADTSNNKIRMITSSGIATTLVDYATITNVSSTISATFTPYGISIDTARKVYFTDKANNRVFTFTIF